MKNKDKVGAISLFSGCGGLDIGCHLSGIPVVVATDNDSDCMNTLRLNKKYYENTKIYHENIVNIPVEKIKSTVKKSSLNKVIIIGGPPCQPFSKASYWVGHKRRKGVNDSRNLIDEFFWMIKKINPDGFVFENVESILHPKHREVISNIKSMLEKSDYNYKIIKANALDYGVPQKRKRIFIVGTKAKFKTLEPKKTHCPPGKCRETGLRPYEGVAKFILKYDKMKYYEKEEETKRGTYGKELQKIPPGENYFALSDRTNIKNPRFKGGTRFWNFLLKLHPDKPSWTIAAQPGPWVGPFHWTARRLRVPEIAAIQTFPDKYTFFGTRRSIQKQIGNAVPVFMAKAIIEFLKENL